MYNIVLVLIVLQVHYINVQYSTSIDSVIGTLYQYSSRSILLPLKPLNMLIRYGSMDISSTTVTMIWNSFSRYSVKYYEHNFQHEKLFVCSLQCHLRT